MSTVLWTKENTLAVIAMVNRLADELTAERERRVELEKQRDRLSREVNNLRYELKEALRCGNLKGDDHG